MFLHRTVARRLRGLVPIAVAVIVSTPAGARQLSTTAAAERQVQTLLDPDADRRTRLDAVHALLDKSDRSALVAMAAGLIADVDDQTGSRAILLEAIADHPGPPTSLLTHLKAGAALDDPRVATPTIRALGAYHDRATVHWLFDLAQSTSDPDIRRAAFGALAVAAVRPELGDKEQAWARWLEVVDLLSDAEWSRGVIARLETRQRRADRELDAMTARLVTAYRNLTLSADDESRTVLLASLLLDDVTALRQLGFELIDRELAEARQLGQPVSDAAIRLLASSDPRVRTAAAGLVNHLAPQEARHAVVVALLAETDPDAAGALLVAAARWPDERSAAPAVNWLELHPDLAQTATQTIDVLLRAGMLDDQWYARILTVLRQIDAGSCNASCLRLLVALGDHDDWARVQAVLDNQTNPLRTAAAEALLSRSETLGIVVERAQQDAELFDITWRAIAETNIDVDGYQTVLALAAPDDESRRAALDQIAARMTLEQIIELANATADPNERARLLRPRMLEPTGNGRRDTALVLLAESELELDAPDAAIAALDRLSETPGDSLAIRARSTRVRALLVLGRFDEAEAIDTDAQVWIDALLARPELPHLQDLILRLETRFPELTVAHRAAIDTLKLAAVVEPEDPDDPPSSPPDP